MELFDQLPLGTQITKQKDSYRITACTTRTQYTRITVREKDLMTAIVMFLEKYNGNVWGPAYGA